MMRKMSMVVLVAFITLPVFAQQKKPTPTPAPKRQGEVKPAPAPVEGKPTKDQLELTGKVVSQSGNTFTVMSNGKQVTFSGAKLKALPKVGDIIDISYTQNLGGVSEAKAFNTSKSNTMREGEVQPAPAPLRGKPTKDQLELTGKVISQSGNTFTVMSNGKQVTFSGATLKALPKVGDIIDISYTQTPSGVPEAKAFNGSKSNTY